MKNPVKFNKIILKPLPSELTPLMIRDAILPAKIIAMSNAISKCVELPELLNYKRTVDGLAAAARTIKHEIPEQVAMLNRTAKEAVMKLGALASQYSNEGTPRLDVERIRSEASKGKTPVNIAADIGLTPHVVRKVINGYNPRHDCGLSPRGMLHTQLGVDRKLIVSAVRIAAAPKKIRERILADDAIPANAYVMSLKTPRLYKGGAKPLSDAAANILGDASKVRLRGAATALRNVSFDAFAQLTDNERKTVREKIIECQELLDAMMQRLGD
jgi:hypothetical protein